jgi:hypothetical protein
MKVFGLFAALSAQNADEFAAELKRLKIPFSGMKPGETITYRGRELRRK